MSNTNFSRIIYLNNASGKSLTFVNISDDYTISAGFRSLMHIARHLGI